MAERSRAPLLLRTISLQLFAVRALPSTYIIFDFIEFFFLSISRGPGVQIPAGNAHFSAAFSSHATYARGSLWGSWIPPGGWGVAESCGNSFKLRNRLKLCSKKSFKIELFKIPSWEFKNIFFLVYPHQTRAPYTPCIPPKFKGHF